MPETPFTPQLEPATRAEFYNITRRLNRRGVGGMSVALSGRMKLLIASVFLGSFACSHDVDIVEDDSSAALFSCLDEACVAASGVEVATISAPIRYLVLPPFDVETPVVSLAPIELAAGEQLKLLAKATIRVRAPDHREYPILAAIRIQCGADPGVRTYNNWELAVKGTGRVVYGQALYTAPSSGPVTCSMLALSATSHEPGELVMEVAPGWANTFLRAEPVATPLAVAWGQENEEVHVGEGTAALTRVLAPPNGDFDAHADLALTTCTPGSQCTVDGQALYSEIHTRLRLARVTAAGDICWRRDEPWKATFVTNWAHHEKIFHHARDVESPQCGDALVLWVEAAVVEGNPIRIEGHHFFDADDGTLPSVAFIAGH